MAEFTRKALKKIFDAAEIEVPKDVLGQLCDLHTDSSDDAGTTIKELQRDLKKAERERDEALEKVPKEGEETVSKKSYDDLKAEYDSYKSDVEAKETAAKKSAAVRELLKEAGISKRVDTVLRVYDMNGVELDKDGKVKDAEKHIEGIKKDWADFIVTEKKKGAKIDNPPGGNGGGGMTKAEIVKIKDPVERRAAIAQNMDLFEKGNDE